MMTSLGKGIATGYLIFVVLGAVMIAGMALAPGVMLPAL